ncbi:MAG TPA: DUF2231 domain-containing protein, partial [Steroidobacteraceae bacterium]|nr:DUF2231 domain-containing protein [Steroidobacteraceae bacterium]
MESRVKLFGHPVHPMLVVFPLGLFVSAVVFDVFYFASDNPRFAFVAYWNIAGGLIGGILAAIFGLIDFVAIPRRTRAWRIGLAHGLGNIAVVALFAVAWVLRRPDALHLPAASVFTLEIVAVGLAGVTAWLGGELVERLGVGV